jgi:glycosyltransferase involved in cell wall biosynthesis
MKEEVKVDYFLSHPIQYFSPLFRKMAEKIDLSVYYYSDLSVKGELDKEFNTVVKWDTPLLLGYKSRVLKNWSGRRSMNNRFRDAINPSVFTIIRKSKSKVVIINGWNYASNWMVMIFGKMLGKQVWLRAESPLNQEFMKSKRVLQIKKIAFGKIIFRFLVDKCLYIGTESRKFFEFYGVPSKKLLYTPYAVDNDYFMSACADKTVGELKKQFHIIEGSKVILFSGKFIEKKRPLDLIKAFHQLNRSDYFLVMVGEGILRTEMETYIATNSIQNIVLTGFVNQALIPCYYKVADLFVMCSGIGETWGLSVNEAMCFGKPVMVSETCGCHIDLVTNGVNGFTFPEADIDSLAAGIKKILENDSLRESMGKASLKKISEFSIDRIVLNISQAVEQI